MPKTLKGTVREQKNNGVFFEGGREGWHGDRKLQRYLRDSSEEAVRSKFILRGQESSNPWSDPIPVPAVSNTINYKQKTPTIQLTNDAKTYFWSFS